MLLKEEERRREKMEREQEEQTLVKMREWENELINDDQQWDEKHREVELQKEENHIKVKQLENELCKGEAQKNVKQRTHEMDTWMNKQQKSEAQRSEENRLVNSGIKTYSY